MRIDPGLKAGRSGWDDVIVLCAANRFDGIRLADQAMAEHLAALGPVLYVDPPLSLLRARRAGAGRDAPALRLQAPGLARFTPVVPPFPSRPGMARLTTAICRGLLRQATAGLGGRVAAVISAWPGYPVLGSCGERTRVYWAQDDFVGGAQLLHLNAAALDKAERRSAAAAHLIVASSPAVADTWRRRGYEPALIPFGTEVAAYRQVEGAPRPGDIRLAGPIAGFVGHVNGRIAIDLLEAIAARGIGLLLVGPRDPAFEPERWARLLGQPNVQWVGPKPFAALPGYLGAIDVGLVPYDGRNAFNIGSFPLKTLEYLAAGRPVVSTDLPATRWLDTDLISVASAPEAFADAVEACLGRPRGEGERQRRRGFAERHDWSVRAAAMRSAIAAAAVPSA